MKEGLNTCITTQKHTFLWGENCVYDEYLKSF